jgi:predicted negative regulator of RcsB-dependent stress response
MFNDVLIGTTGVLLQVQAQTDTSSDVNEVWSGWGSVIFVLSMTGIIALIAALVIWQLFRTRQTKMMSDARVAESNAYRSLAEDATAAQNHTAEELKYLRESMADLRTRVASIERMLAEVG